MALLDGIAKRLGYAKATVNNSPTWLQAEAQSEQFSIPDRHLPESQLELYQRLSWVQIAVAAVAETAATTKFNVMTLAGEKTRAIENHPFEILMRRPNPLYSRFELLVATLSYRALTGNCYWWLNRRDEKTTPDEIWVIPAQSIKPVPDNKMFLKGYIYEPSAGVTVPLETYEVVHFRRWHPLNPYVGLSPVESFAIDAEGELAMQKWNTNLFAKDNAKVPGALAFADPINDGDWERMKSEIKREHGGTKRSLMMLRNVGQGGVQWVQMAMSQNDMQFLQARTFTKEEIFAIYAPGYASMLAVNATEANSVAGKSTFIGMGVYPNLVQIAEKITNDILPSYGDNLVGEFEDIRPSDKLLALQEQVAAERVHTVDEIREMFYSARPIGDERGNLLVVEVGRSPAQPQMVDENQPMREGNQDQPVPKEEPSNNRDSGSGSDGDRVNLEEPQQDKPEDTVAKRAEIKAFKAWIKKRPTADIHTFKAVHLSHDELHDIAEDIRGVAAEQPFFTLPETFTRESVGALKAMILQLDPNDDEAEQKIRMELERRSARNIDKAFTEMINILYPDGYGSTGAFVDPNIEANRIHRAFVEDQALRDAVSRALIDSADLGVSIGIGQLENVGIGFDYLLTHTAARDWAIAYTDTLLEQMGVTSGRLTGRAVARWFENREPLEQLIQDLEPVFGRKRAERIAATEVTRAAAEGSRQAYIDSGVIKNVVWRTARDERVCPVCGPLEGVYAGMDGVFRGGVTVPAHVQCRCWISPVVRS